jgi:hypothetical protein
LWSWVASSSIWVWSETAALTSPILVWPPAMACSAEAGRLSRGCSRAGR